MFGVKQAEAAQADWREFVIEALIRVLGFSTIGFVLLIFLFLLREGIPIFWEVPLSNLFGTRWYPTFNSSGPCRSCWDRSSLR
jgi:ABC-type phosphate transport system permease subunit